MTKAQFLSRLAKLTRRYPLHSQDDASDPVFVAKLFSLAGSATWYIAEYDPETHIAF